MKILNFDMGDDGSVELAAVEASLTIRGTVKMIADVEGSDFDVLSGLVYGQLDEPVSGTDPEWGDRKNIDLEMSVVEDDETKARYLVIGDTNEDQDVYFSVRYSTPDGLSIFMNFGGDALVKFWDRAQNEMLNRKAQSSGQDQTLISILIAGLQFAKGEHADIAGLFNEWLQATGREGGVELITQLKKAA